MADLSQLSHAEKVLFAGCIQAVMLADGRPRDEEIKDFDRIYRKLSFQDYEECLNEFEQKIPDEPSLLKEAQQVRNPAAQDLILSTLYELTVQYGAPDDAEEALFRKLSRIWEKT